MKSPYSKFTAAFNFYKMASAKYGDNHPVTEQAFRQTLQHTPKHVINQLYQIATNHLPAPDGYNDDGQPVYAPETLANHFGVSAEEVESRLISMGAQVVHLDDIHRAQ